MEKSCRIWKRDNGNHENADDFLQQKIELLETYLSLFNNPERNSFGTLLNNQEINSFGNPDIGMFCQNQFNVKEKSITDANKNLTNETADLLGLQHYMW